MFDGSCHCGALTIRLATASEPRQLPVRMCGCTFCLRHQPRYTSDPAGHVTIRLATADAASRYRFGLRLADFLVCRTCGVFVAAHEPGAVDHNLGHTVGHDLGRAVINLNVL